MSDQQGLAAGDSSCGFAVIDLETTGFMPSHGDRVVEIAVVRCSPSGQIQDECLLVSNAPVLD